MLGPVFEQVPVLSAPHFAPQRFSAYCPTIMSDTPQMKFTSLEEIDVVCL